MNKLITTVIGLSALISASAFADSSITLEDSFTLPAKGTLYLDVSVGQVVLETSDTSDIKATVVLKHEYGIWADEEDSESIISKAKINHKLKGDKLYIEMNNEELIQKWTLSVPKNTSLVLDVGVGEVDLKGQLAGIKADVGVGHVIIDMPHKDYKTIELESGVGEIDIAGFDGAELDQGMLGTELEWHGNGQYEMDIEVGVGAININTKPAE